LPLVEFPDGQFPETLLFAHDPAIMAAGSHNHRGWTVIRTWPTRD
jgi:hypothetical protein